MHTKGDPPLPRGVPSGIPYFFEVAPFGPYLEKIPGMASKIASRSFSTGGKLGNMSLLDQHTVPSTDRGQHLRSSWENIWAGSTSMGRWRRAPPEEKC